MEVLVRKKLGKELNDALFNVDSGTLSGIKNFDRNIDINIHYSFLSCYNQELYLIEDSTLGLLSNSCLMCRNCSFSKGFNSTSHKSE
ncbi:hypothetical protein TNIN_359641 [Trichonephila inaurata madagascariensis]|uniref:Uncharacterized protein n=1 Tax=Trichonephila inaurata madagascariensis TaxID=2747483 RepID=A0A8X6X7L2_9ARAC|nr:hypothetical protein TNIN_359641 [Trichonephila inaurata madagascariensis]